MFLSLLLKIFISVFELISALVSFLVSLLLALSVFDSTFEIPAFSDCSWGGLRFLFSRTGWYAVFEFFSQGFEITMNTPPPIKRKNKRKKIILLPSFLGWGRCSFSNFSILCHAFSS